MTPLERMAARYWNAFREGFATAGGNALDYPTWDKSNDPVKEETLRCMRHAVEELKKEWTKSFDQVFPGKPQRRRIRRTATEDRFAAKQRPQV